MPADQEEAIKTQISEAVAPEEPTEDTEGDGEEDLSELEKREKALSDEREAFEKEKAQIAKQKAELSEKQAEASYAKLLSEGKIVPAQKESYLALCAAQETKVQLSDTETKTVAKLLSELFEAMPDMRLQNNLKTGDQSLFLVFR